MPQGLEIYDAAGVLKLGVTSRVFKRVATASVTENVPAAVPLVGREGSGALIVQDLGFDEDMAVPVIASATMTTANIDWQGGVGGSTAREISIFEV